MESQKDVIEELKQIESKSSDKPIFKILKGSFSNLDSLEYKTGSGRHEFNKLGDNLYSEKFFNKNNDQLGFSMITKTDSLIEINSVFPFYMYSVRVIIEGNKLTIYDTMIVQNSNQKGKIKKKNNQPITFHEFTSELTFLE